MGLLKKLFSRKYWHSKSQFKLQKQNYDESHLNETNLNDLCDEQPNLNKPSSNISRDVENGIELDLDDNYDTDTSSNISVENDIPDQPLHHHTSNNHITTKPTPISPKTNKILSIRLNDPQVVDDNSELEIIIKELNRIVLERESLRRRLTDKTIYYKALKRKFNQISTNKLYKPIRMFGSLTTGLNNNLEPKIKAKTITNY